jgi:hypothetical protein
MSVITFTARVQFLRRLYYGHFKKGKIAHPLSKHKINNHLGETRVMNCGMECKIIKYFKYNNITVQFTDGTIVNNKQYDSFKKGNIKNPNCKKTKKQTRIYKCLFLPNNQIIKISQ